MNLTKKTTITILLGIVLLGAGLRFYHLGSTSFVADEFLDINSSMAYAKTGQWQNWDFNFERVNVENEFAARDSRAWIYKWQVAQVLKIFPVTEGSARAVSALWGVATISLIYFAASYFTKKREIGLISAFLFAVSISGIIFDRKLRMYAMFFPVYLAFSWLMYRFFEEEYQGKIKIVAAIYEKFKVNLIYLVPTLILGIISLFTHQLTASVVFVVIIYCLVQLVRSKNKFSLFNKYFLSSLVLAISYVVAAVFYKNQLAVYSAGIEFFTSHWSYFYKVFDDYSNLVLAILFLIAGAYYLYKKIQLKKEALWLLASFGGILLPAMFLWDRNTGDQYIFFIRSFEIILIAAGIYFVWEFSAANFSQYKKAAFYAPLVLILLVLPNWVYFFGENNTYHQTSSGDSANYKKIFGYFMKTKDPQDVIIARNFRNFYWQGAKIEVFDFGGELAERKLSVSELRKIVSENPSGWLIYSDNDDAYIVNEAVDFAVKNLERVSHPQVRGKVAVYRWGKREN